MLPVNHRPRLLVPNNVIPYCQCISGQCISGQSSSSHGSSALAASVTQCCHGCFPCLGDHWPWPSLATTVYIYDWSYPSISHPSPKYRQKPITAVLVLAEGSFSRLYPRESLKAPIGSGLWLFRV